MKRIGSFLFILFLSLNLNAATDVTATVDSNKIELGDSITLTISVSTSDSLNVGTPRLPSLDGFNIVGQNEGLETRSTFVNGQFQVNQTRSFNFVLSPIRQGKLRIGEVEVVAGNQSLKTRPIDVDVVAPGAGGGRPRPKSQAQNGGQNQGSQTQQDALEEDPFFQDADDLFAQLLQRRGLTPPRGIKTQPINADEAFFVQADVDKTTVYEKEQVTVSFYLVTPYQIRDLDPLKLPDLKGFDRKDIEIATRLNFQKEIINGVAYNKALLASYALFPFKAGTATIDSYKVKCTVLTPSNMLGMGTPYAYTKASQPVKITVKPLPTNQPTDFTGAVGQFQVNAKLEGGNRVPINQPFSYKIRIEGKGNATVMQQPSLNLPTDLELYDTKEDAKFMRDGTSYKEFEMFLIPRRQGKFTIPAFTISSFDPAQGKFVQAGAPAVDIEVGAGRPGENYQSSPLNLTQQEKKTRDLPMPLASYSSPVNLSTSQWASVWSVSYLGVFFFLLLRTRKALGLGAKRDGLKTQVRKRMKNVYKALSSSDHRKVGSESINALVVTLGALTKEGATTGELDKILRSLPPSIQRDTEKEAKELYTYFESLAFAPESYAVELYKSAKEKVKKLESFLERSVSLSKE